MTKHVWRILCILIEREEHQPIQPKPPYAQLAFRFFFRVVYTNRLLTLSKPSDAGRTLYEGLQLNDMETCGSAKQAPRVPTPRRKVSSFSLTAGDRRWVAPIWLRHYPASTILPRAITLKTHAVYPTLALTPSRAICVESLYLIRINWPPNILLDTNPAARIASFSSGCRNASATSSIAIARLAHLIESVAPVQKTSSIRSLPEPHLLHKQWQP